MPAAERRELVLEAAVAEFAVHGLAGTSTEDVARRAGISQPYLFRLFPTKKALFLALVDRCFQRVQGTFAAAAGDLTGDEALTAMADSYTRLLDDRTLLLLQMQIYAACNEDQAQFKGIFVRYLHDLWLHSRRPGYRGFILANANSVWDHARNPSAQSGPPQFGLHWAGPFDQATPARQSSALDLLTAAAALTS